MTSPENHSPRLFLLREADADEEQGRDRPPGLRVLLNCLRSHWLRIALCTLLGTALAAAATFLIPRAYRSQASLLIPRTTPGATAVSEDSLLEKLLPAEGRKQKEQTIMAYLHSKALARQMITRNDLLPVLYRAPLARLQFALRRAMGGGPGSRPSLDLALQENRLAAIFWPQSRSEEPVVDLFLEAPTPEQARDMLAQAVDLLGRYLREEYVSDAARERRRLETLCSEAETRVARWERVTPDARTSRLMIQRNLLAARKVFLELRLRLAAARAEEARQAVDFKVLDPPTLSVLPARPQRLLLVLGGLLFSLFTSCALVLLREALHRQTRHETPFRTPDAADSPSLSPGPGTHADNAPGE